MSILCGQQNGWGVIYMQIARNNYSHYWLITTNSDPPTPTDTLVPCHITANENCLYSNTKEWSHL